MSFTAKRKLIYRPPDRALSICSALCGINWNGGKERVLCEVIDVNDNAGIYKLTFPQANGNQPFTDESSFAQLRRYCLTIEELLLSGCKTLALESLFVKIVAFDECNDFGTSQIVRFKQIYDSVQESGISCVKYHCKLDSSYYIIISEKADSNLRVYLDTHNFSLVEKISLCRQYAELIAKLHKKKIFHGDLKPENVLVLSKGEVVSLKLTDFESSCTDETGFKTIHYSPLYYKANVDNMEDLEKHDLFCLGVNFIDILESDGTPNTERHDAIRKQEKFNNLSFPTKSFPKIKEIINHLYDHSIGIENVIYSLKEIESKMELDAQPIISNIFHTQLESIQRKLAQLEIGSKEFTSLNSTLEDFERLITSMITAKNEK